MTENINVYGWGRWWEMKQNNNLTKNQNKSTSKMVSILQRPLSDIISSQPEFNFKEPK